MPRTRHLAGVYTCLEVSQLRTPRALRRESRALPYVHRGHCAGRPLRRNAVADVLDEDRILLPAEKLTALPGACHRLVSDPMPSRLWLLADSGALLLQYEPPVQAGS